MKLRCWSKFEGYIWILNPLMSYHYLIKERFFVVAHLIQRWMVVVQTSLQTNSFLVELTWPKTALTLKKWRWAGDHCFSYSGHMNETGHLSYCGNNFFSYQLLIYAKSNLRTPTLFKVMASLWGGYYLG